MHSLWVQRLNLEFSSPKHKNSFSDSLSGAGGIHLREMLKLWPPQWIRTTSAWPPSSFSPWAPCNSTARASPPITPYIFRPLTYFITLPRSTSFCSGCCKNGSVWQSELRIQTDMHLFSNGWLIKALPKHYTLSLICCRRKCKHCWQHYSKGLHHMPWRSCTESTNLCFPS
jgi:hypothetical protein